MKIQQRRHISVWILPAVFLSALMVPASLSAQTPGDSADIFFEHVALGEATVTGVTGRTRLKDSPAPAMLLSEQTLRHSVGTNIVAAIAHQPGMSQLSTGSGISKPIIRGLGFNRIVCINDGVRQEGQQWGDEHGLEIDGSSIHAVEVLKGPASLMYGSDAMAGVVIFQPLPTRTEGTMGGTAEMGFQTNSGLWNYSLAFSGNKSGYVWDARFSQRAAHAYKNKIDGRVPGTQFAEQALRLMAGIDRSWGYSHLTFSFFHFVPSIAEGERDAETGMLEAPQGWSGLSYGKTLPFQQIHHTKFVWDNRIRLGTGALQAIVGYQQNRRKEYEDSKTDFNLYLQQHTLTYDVRYLATEWESWKMTAGVGGMFQRSLNKAEEVLIPAYRLFDIGAYVTGSRSWEKFILSGGIRLDSRSLHSYERMDDGALRFAAFSRSWQAVSGSIGGVWRPLLGMNVRLNLARGYRAPNIAELGSNGIHEGSFRYEVGNSRLRAEHSLQADIGIDYVNRYVSVQVAAFLNRIDNYIFSARNGEVRDGRPVYQYASGDARLWGFEVGIDFHPVHSLHIENSFSYVNAVQLHQPAASKYLPMIPAPRLRSELKWELTHEPWSIFRGKAALHKAFMAAGMSAFFRQDHVFRADATETPTPFYCLFDVSLGTEIYVKGRQLCEIFLSVDNLLNRAYQSHLSRLKYTDVNALTGHQGIYDPGRNMTLRLIFPFGKN